MMATRCEVTPVTATLGFAARADGAGVAYVALGAADGRDASLVRVAFRCRPLPALLGRDVAYAALEAAATQVRSRGERAVSFGLDDATVPADLRERRALPSALIVPYVRLRCVLNRFADASVHYVADAVTRDLTARARLEASLGVAA